MNETTRDELLFELITKRILNPKLQQEIQTSFKLQQIVKANCDPKCDCEYGDCYHSICEQMIK